MTMPVTLEETGPVPLLHRAAARPAVALAALVERLPPRRLRWVLGVARCGARPASAARTLAARRAVVAVSVRCAGQGCLRRSIAVALLCRFGGTWPDWCTGVRTDPFRAHAWVEAEGAPIGEPDDTRLFHLTMTVRAATRRRHPRERPSGGSRAVRSRIRGTHARGKRGVGDSTEESRAETTSAQESRAAENRADGRRAEGNHVEGSRADKSRADKRRAGGSRADKSRADKSRAGGSHADGSRADGSRAGGSHVEGSRAGGTRVGGSHVEGSRTDRSRADRSRAGGSGAEGIRADKSRADGSRADGSRADGSRAGGRRNVRSRVRGRWGR